MPQVRRTRMEDQVNVESSDVAVLDLIRRSGGMTVGQLATRMGVTATAVRQRLSRVMAAGLVDRQPSKGDRGRPRHTYRLTEKGRRQTGSNFADLAWALWQEVRAIEEPAIRRGLLQRLSRRLSELYASSIAGETTEERMRSLADVFAEREIPFEVGRNEAGLPVLKALGCPYTDLAEEDPSICAMERMLFADVLGASVKLTQCRLDGETCCTFQLN